MTFIPFHFVVLNFIFFSLNSLQFIASLTLPSKQYLLLLDILVNLIPIKYLMHQTPTSFMNHIFYLFLLQPTINFFKRLVHQPIIPNTPIFLSIKYLIRSLSPMSFLIQSRQQIPFKHLLILQHFFLILLTTDLQIDAFIFLYFILQLTLLLEMFLLNLIDQ